MKAESVIRGHERDSDRQGNRGFPAYNLPASPQNDHEWRTPGREGWPGVENTACGDPRVLQSGTVEIEQEYSEKYTSEMPHIALSGWCRISPFLKAETILAYIGSKRTHAIYRTLVRITDAIYIIHVAKTGKTRTICIGQRFCPHPHLSPKPS